MSLNDAFKIYFSDYGVQCVNRHIFMIYEEEK